MNKDIKVEDNKQKTKDACPAETEADSELMPKITTSRPACSNTFVCVQRSCLCDESRALGGRSGATFTIKPVVCCVDQRSRLVNLHRRRSGDLRL